MTKRKKIFLLTKNFLTIHVPVLFLHYFCNKHARKWYLKKMGHKVDEVHILGRENFIGIPDRYGGLLIATTKFRWLSSFVTEKQ